LAEVPHGDAGESDVLAYGPIYRFESQTAAAFEDAVRDGDVLESAVGFRSAFDTPGRKAVQPRIGVSLPCAVQEGAELIVPGDKTIRDGYIFGRPCISKGEAGLGANTVIPRRIDAAVGYPHILAAITIDAIAVSIDLEVVDSEVVDGCQ
jgi:hypothetical protein